jgi:hypothetical protein
MNWGRIPDRDSLYRLCTHPISFNNRGRFVPRKVITLYDQVDGSLLASVAWERFVPTAPLVHAYGCRLALGINQRAVAAGRSRQKSIYCGAYQLRASAIRALPNEVDEIASADVIHHIESGEISHTDLRIVLATGSGLNVETTKTAIMDRLWWHVFRGPMKHICDCDNAIVPHPNSNLDAAPLGACVDTRSNFERRWSVVRYGVFSWLWRVIFSKFGG